MTTCTSVLHSFFAEGARVVACRGLMVSWMLRAAHCCTATAHLQSCNLTWKFCLLGIFISICMAGQPGEVDDSLVLALLATPFRTEGRIKKDSKKNSNRRFKAESTALRNSDLAYILDGVNACNNLSDAHRAALNNWSQKGHWAGDTLQTVGAIRLRKPRSLTDLGQCRSREDFILWHAWGSPSPHDRFPNFLFFDIADAVCFHEPQDHRPFVNHLRTSEQRTAWSVHLSEEAFSDLKQAQCMDGRIFEQCLLDWGATPNQCQYPVFTSLPPIVFLAAHRQWHTLADIPRCTPQLLRRPRGTSCQTLCSNYHISAGLILRLFFLLDRSSCLGKHVINGYGFSHGL